MAQWIARQTLEQRKRICGFESPPYSMSYSKHDILCSSLFYRFAQLEFIIESSKRSTFQVNQGLVEVNQLKDVLYSMFGPDLVGLTVAV